MKIRGTTQIIAGSIDNTLFKSGLNLATSQLTDGSLFLKSDGTVNMSASLNLNNQTITNLATPVNTTDAATKAYADGVVTGYFRANGTVTATGAFAMGGFKITGLAEPTASGDAATKNYVDSVATGLDVKSSVKAATTGNITLSATQTIDGVALSVGDRVLVKDQSTASANGIYVVASGAWTRATDADSSTEVTSGMFTFVEQGTANADSGWVLTTDGPITIGTTNLTFAQFSGAGSISAGNGLSKTGNSLSVLSNSTAIGVTASGVALTVDAASVLTVGASGLTTKTITGAQILLGNASGIVTATTVTGDVTISNSGVTTVSTNTSTGFTKYSAHITNETPTGLINGSNTTYTLASTPVAGSEQVYVNGILQEPGAGNDYTMSAATLTMLYTLQTGDKLKVCYIR